MCTEKTAKQTTDIILYDHKVIVFKMESDVMLYVVGSAEENEVLLYRYGHGIHRGCRIVVNRHTAWYWLFEIRSTFF